MHENWYYHLDMSRCLSVGGAESDLGFLPESDLNILYRRYRMAMRRMQFTGLLLNSEASQDLEMENRK